MRRIAKGIHTAPPRGVVLFERRNRKCESFPECVEHQMQNDSSGFQMNRGREAVGRVPPVRLAQGDAVPFNGVKCDQLVQRHVMALQWKRARRTESDQLPDESM